MFTENTIQDVERIRQKSQSCQKVFAAFGDETRQYIISVLLCGECSGSCVLDIAGRANLSCPTVSHHMQVLKNAGIVKTRKDGTLVYYYLDPEDSDICLYDSSTNSLKYNILLREYSLNTLTFPLFYDII